MGTSLKTRIATRDDVTAIVDYLQAPTRLNAIRGTRHHHDGPAFVGLLELLPDAKDGVTEIAVGTHPDPEMQLPVHTCGFNRRWMVSNWQVAGFAGAGHYHDDAKGGTTGNGRWTELGLDDLNCTHVPIYVGRAPRTQIVIGHPVIALGSTIGANDLFIQVTYLLLPNGSKVFHVAVNNPTDSDVTATLTSAGFGGGNAVAVMAPPTQVVTLAAGEDRVIQ